ncbi:MAG TPA: HAD family phosphatase [Candidatus Bathyarchaeia archaeon]|nr:HAD family phosphatase [Candidatus Bathyarchaeia archaeon]
MIRLFVFDLGNVILPFEHRQIAVKLHKVSQIPDLFTPDDLFRFLFDRDHGFVNPYEEGCVSSLDFFTKLKDRYKMELEFDEFKDIWNPIFEEDPEVNAIITHLKSKGYPLFLLSNTNELHFSYVVERYPIVRSFDEWILSYRVGIRKPKQEIYDAVFEKTDIARRETLYIDDIKVYADAAKTYGLQGLHFKNAKDLRRLLKENCV